MKILTKEYFKLLYVLLNLEVCFVTYLYNLFKLNLIIITINIYLISANHSQILSNDFTKELAQHLRDRQNEKTCLGSLHLVGTLLKYGSDEIRSAIKADVSGTLGR